MLVLKVDYDSSRLVKIWPRPEMPEHIIHFEHGSDPSRRSWRDLTKQLDEFFLRYRPSAYRSDDVVICDGRNHWKT
ncbi:hypothetical protein CDAR_321191 [Caerostris darwini]|uniref:Uncharacterized protein n=1 Tax=Caerostris darwini TaxID=1538125 RepID=A0AAV4TDC2_9ARAC|nr:hypothetical protein CDAR_321191 [Caerostris darwini]